MTTAQISCPVCGAADLTVGEIVGRSPGVKFKRRAGLMGDYFGIPLTKGFFILTAPAMRCEKCATVVVPGRR